MEPTLAVIGLNFRSSPVAVRERFWMTEAGRVDTLNQLVRTEGIDEILVLVTCHRTEFILWANDASAAANSVLRFLTQEYQLKLCEWSHFYRLMDDVALTHIFRVAAGLDSMAVGDPETTAKVKKAWSQAQDADTTGRFLEAVMQKAMTVAQRVHGETGLASPAVSAPQAAVRLSKRILGELSGREVLLIGAGMMSELAAQALRSAGVTRIKVMNRTLRNGELLAQKLGARAVGFEHRVEHLKHADIVVSSTSSRDFVITRSDAEAAMRARDDAPMVIIDAAVPRDVEPTVRGLAGIHLFDADDLGAVIKHSCSGQPDATVDAERIIREEVAGFRRKLMTEQVIPTIVALRQHLDEVCRQELEILRQEFGPFTEDQDQAMTALTSHITQRIAGSLARELKDLPERNEQEVLAAAVHRLFRLQQPLMAAAGAKN